MRSKTVLATFVFPLALMAVLLSILSTSTLSGQAAALPASADAAHVVVVFPGEQGTVRPISFTAPISRVGALRLAGWEVVADGGTVCSINGIGCPATNCFCADNWWSSAGWNPATMAWDAASWPPPDVLANGIAGFRWSNTDWGAPKLPGPAYVAGSKALDWLRPRQVISDGGYGSMGSTVETLLAIGANNLRAADWKRQPDSASLLGYAMGNGAAYAGTGADASAKVASGLSAADGCWPLNALRPMDFYSPTTGAFRGGYGYGSGPQAWAILGTRSLSQSVPVTAVQYLRNAQQPNGGWEWQAGFGSDTNSAALALQALVSIGEPVTSSAIISGLAFLKSAQNADGGFAYDPASPWGTASDTNSTAYVVQSLLAVGHDPITGTWAVTSSNPISYLIGMQLPDGSFEYQKGLGANQVATQQAIPALLGRPFPLTVADLTQCRGVFMPIVLR
jgi:hypothetical protein